MKLFIVFVFCGLVVAQREQYWGNPGQIMFPGPVASRNSQIDSRALIEEPQSDLAQEIALAKQLSEITSLDAFLNMLDIPDSDIGVSMINRFGGEERTSVIDARPANCMPELHTVPLEPDITDPSVTYFPECTRIKRCGGCCSHPKLSCQPNTTEWNNYRVRRFKKENGKLKYNGQVIIPLEEHTSCSCQCRTKEKDCTKKQIYVPNECRCKCLNTKEEDNCRKPPQNLTKRWVDETCTCECAKVQDCNSGSIFDESTCSCQKVEDTRNNRKNEYIPAEGRGPSFYEGILTFHAPNSNQTPAQRRRHKDEPKD